MITKQRVGRKEEFKKYEIIRLGNWEYYDSVKLGREH